MNQLFEEIHRKGIKMFDLLRRGWLFRLSGKPWIHTEDGTFEAKALAVEIDPQGEMAVYIKDLDNVSHHGVDRLHPMVAKALSIALGENRRLTEGTCREHH